MDNNTFLETEQKDQSFIASNPALNEMDLPPVEPAGNGEASNIEDNNQSFIANNPALNEMDLPPVEPIQDEESMGGRPR